ncbi:MAG: hypothetical protein K2P78_06260 [Gemmataceae bacterium]|nr:hypothetical protein [Gemmataceae bacterium]
MNAPLYVTPHPPIPLPEMQPSLVEVADLLRQSLDLQREQVHLTKVMVANQDALSRWKAFLARWQAEFPDIGQACKQVLPAVERAFLTMVRELTDRLRADEPEDLTDEFVLNEFLDRYGIRLGQLATIISQLAPLADAAPPPAPPSDTTSSA